MEWGEKDSQKQKEPSSEVTSQSNELDDELRDIMMEYSRYHPEDDREENEEEIDIEDDEEDEEEEGEEDIDVETVEEETPAAKRRKLYGADVDDIYGTGEMDSELGLGKRRRKKGKRGPKPKFTPELAKMMGEAHMMYALQNYQGAIPILQELVRLAPNVADPYQTLGLIYKDLHENAKAVEFFMIAAHLTPKDTELWKNLGLMSRDLGKYRQAIYCFTKAIRRDPNDLDAIWDRSMIYMETKDYKKAIEGFRLLLKNRPKDPDITKELARLYHLTGHPERAIEVLEGQMSETSKADLHGVNILVELRMGVGQFYEASQIVENLGVPLETLPMDLIVNYGICLTYLHHFVEASKCFDLLAASPPGNFPDLYYHVGEALISVGRYAEAMQFLEPLTQLSPVDGSVWRSLGECQIALEKPSEAVESFQKAITLQPSDVSSVVSIAKLLRQLKRSPEAMAIVDTYIALSTMSPEVPGSSHQIDLGVAVQKGLLHLDCGEQENFLHMVFPILVDNSLFFGKNNRKKRKKKTKLIEVVEDEGENILHFQTPMTTTTTIEPVEETPDVSRPSLYDILGEEELYHLVLQCCRVLSSLERFGDAAEVLQNVMQLIFVDKQKQNHLKFLAVEIAFYCENYTAAYDSVRYVCSVRPDSLPLWNLFNKIITKTKTFISHVKFMSRLLAKHPSSLPLSILVGHHYSMGGSHKLALKQYFNAYKLKPKDPFISFCLGLSYLNLSMNRRVPDRHHCVMKAFTFLFSYYKLSNHNQEATFNLGRAFHQLGIFHLALEFYQKVLDQKPSDQQPNLHMEAAFNMSLIYKASNSPLMAQKVLMDHVVI